MEAGERGIELALVLQRVAQVVVGFRVVRLQSDGFTEAIDGFVELLAAAKRVAEIVMRSRLI